ncbi:MAG: hypothetical protein AB8B49_06225 [Nitratireductor sp.]
MINWKNKPINELSRNELIDALTQAINLNFTKQGFRASNNVGSTFALGFGSGVFIAISGFLIGTLI